ncbi:phospho-N-acetylmuramoyl-pentapeptide-transferase [Acutalibacter sp. 1XD8-33]|uniref:phospho-N-acetylmuramoyl-pentapeptide- transferase n=1 Tax=Acutalibacter sp. 1XD8-33 TaxID=2320081 RepID=UPI000EA3413B|nr:phospho-N-acetylmuramoyl-pentapeptide-transferase [Acutalibacter sp. 1XD8-33]RKJ42209.1 phospho-N-acetylmuramoyl-pentapeptide-transferase [Acutalibacter sp. 1XD8-33]
MSSYLYLTVALVAFALTAVLGLFVVPFLHKLKFGQTIREVGPSWHKNKQGTPTMGGIMFIIGIAAAVLACVPVFYSWSGPETRLMQVRVFGGLAMAAAYGAIGFMDDYIGIVKKRNLGLTERQKLVLQFLVAAAYLATLRLSGDDTATVIPFFGTVELGLFYYPLAAILIVGLTNAVNFTDGVDGLEATVSFFVFTALSLCGGVLSMVGLSAMGVASAAACIGFLIWNFHPAKVFMGDTGSLFLGGMVGALAFGMDMPVLLLPLGVVYWAEMLSVVLQVSYFKATHGKRLFKMSPIHHHFEMSGWSEVKVCGVFGLAALLGGGLAVLAVAFGV